MGYGARLVNPPGRCNSAGDVSQDRVCSGGGFRGRSDIGAQGCFRPSFPVTSSWSGACFPSARASSGCRFRPCPWSIPQTSHSQHGPAFTRLRTPPQPASGILQCHPLPLRPGPRPHWRPARIQTGVRGPTGPATRCGRPSRRLNRLPSRAAMHARTAANFLDSPPLHRAAQGSGLPALHSSSHKNLIRPPSAPFRRGQHATHQSPPQIAVRVSTTFPALVCLAVDQLCLLASQSLLFSHEQRPETQKSPGVLTTRCNPAHAAVPQFGMQTNGEHTRPG